MRSRAIPQTAAKGESTRKPPGGRRVSKPEVQRRLDHADKMLRDGKPRAEVVESMVSTFGVSTRAADSYIARARERWAEESKGAREVERTSTLARLARLSGKAEKRGHFGAAVSAEKLRAQVTGLLAPHAIEVKATIAAPPPQPEEPLTDEDIDRELSEIALFFAYVLQGRALAPSADVVENVRVLAELVGVSSSARAVRPRAV